MTRQAFTHVFDADLLSIVLDTELIDPGGYVSNTHEVQTATAAVPTVLDLNGHGLDLNWIVIEPGASL